MVPRHETIRDLLASGNEVTVRDLAEQLDVSVMTIRRDLAFLEEKGELLRTHGGAVIASPGVVEFSFRQQGECHAAEKSAIAREAAALVEPGMAICLDTGTTTLELSRFLAATPRLQVLTSSLPIASVLYARDNIDLVLLGGSARKGNPDLSGWLTEENVRRFHVDIAFAGADGVTDDGIYTTDLSIARVTQAMIANSREAVLLVDHSKFGQTAFVRYADWSSFSHVFTDDGLSRPLRKKASALTRNLHIASMPGNADTAVVS